MQSILSLIILILPLLVTAAASTAADDLSACPDILHETPAVVWQPLLSDRNGNNPGVRLDPSRLAALAAPLAVPRPVGSSGHRLVRDRLMVSLRGLGADWQVELDTFEAETPLGRRRFDNIVATLPARPGPAKARRLVLAAHYDSKRLPGRSFVGATDSAVPCAALLLMAETLSQRLTGSGLDIGVQLVFFDGEEAFEQWTATDSLYGSRHLARRWSAEEGANPGCQSAREIEALVLLDLIGGRDPRFYYNPHPDSSERLIAKEMRLFQELVAMETALTSGRGGGRRRYFQWPRLGSGLVQDDQAPFQAIGVPAVHVIPQSFPSVWHTEGDTLEAVEWDQATDVATIVFAWLAQKVGLGDKAI